MNWKISEVFQQPLNFFNSAKNNPEPPSNLVNEGEDDLGIEHFQHKGTVSFRRVESAVHNFVDVALPADLDRLHQHQINIKKWRQMKNFSKLRVEYTNASRTIKQLTRNINEMETLRSRVVEADLYIFDRHLIKAKEKAKDSIRAFLELHGEELNDDGQIRDLHEGEHNASDFATESNNEKHLENKSIVQLQGNKLVMDSDKNLDMNEFSTPYYGTIPNYDSEHDKSDHKNSPCGIQTLQLESDDRQAEELWENLRDDIVDLHSVITDLSTVVHEQGEMVDDISSNIEKASENVEQGNAQLRKATILKAAVFPVLGAVVGGVVGGPIGAFAGFKLGSITTGVAAAGATGTFLGYQGGKFLKEHQQADAYEMTKLEEETTENSKES